MSVLFTVFLLKKGHFQSSPKWAEAGAKARADLIIPRGQSVSNHVVQAPKRNGREDLEKRRTERAIRAQLFEGRLDDLGLDLTQVSFSFAQKHFLGEFSLLFLRASNQNKNIIPFTETQNPSNEENILLFHY